MHFTDEQRNLIANFLSQYGETLVGKTWDEAALSNYNMTLALTSFIIHHQFQKDKYDTVLSILLADLMRILNLPLPEKIN